MPKTTVASGSDPKRKLNKAYDALRWPDAKDALGANGCGTASQRGTSSTNPVDFELWLDVAFRRVGGERSIKVCRVDLGKLPRVG